MIFVKQLEPKWQLRSCCLSEAASTQILNISKVEVDHEDSTARALGVGCASHSVISSQCLQVWSRWWPGYSVVSSDWRCGSVCPVGMGVTQKSQQLRRRAGTETCKWAAWCRYCFFSHVHFWNNNFCVHLANFPCCNYVFYIRVFFCIDFKVHTVDLSALISPWIW